MSAPTEEIAIWVLEALKEEWERDSSLLTCRVESTVLGSLKLKHKIEDSDIQCGIKFLVTRGMFESVNRTEGRATFTSRSGFDFLAAHLVCRKQKAKDEFDRRIRVYSVIIAIIAIACTVVGMLLNR